MGVRVLQQTQQKPRHIHARSISAPSTIITRPSSAGFFVVVPADARDCRNFASHARVHINCTHTGMATGGIVKVLGRVQFRLIKIHRYVVKLIGHFACARDRSLAVCSIRVPPVATPIAAGITGFGGCR